MSLSSINLTHASMLIVEVPIVFLFLFCQVLFDAVSSLVFCSRFFLPFVLVCQEGLIKALCERKALGPWPGLFEDVAVVVKPRAACDGACQSRASSRPPHAVTHWQEALGHTAAPSHQEELPVVDDQDSGLILKTSDMQSASCEQVCVWRGKQLVNINGCSDMPKCLLWMIVSGRQAWMGLYHIL